MRAFDWTIAHGADFGAPEVFCYESVYPPPHPGYEPVVRLDEDGCFYTADRGGSYLMLLNPNAAPLDELAFEGLGRILEEREVTHLHLASGIRGSNAPKVLSDAVRKHADQITVLTIGMPKPCDVNFPAGCVVIDGIGWLVRLSGILPHLEELHVGRVEYCDNYIALLNAVAKFPRLKTLELDNIPESLPHGAAIGVLYKLPIKKIIVRDFSEHLATLRLTLCAIPTLESVHMTVRESALLHGRRIALQPHIKELTFTTISPKPQYATEEVAENLTRMLRENTGLRSVTVDGYRLPAFN